MVFKYKGFGISVHCDKEDGEIYILIKEIERAGGRRFNDWVKYTTNVLHFFSGMNADKNNSYYLHYGTHDDRFGCWARLEFALAYARWCSPELGMLLKQYTEGLYMSNLLDDSEILKYIFSLHHDNRIYLDIYEEDGQFFFVAGQVAKMIGLSKASNMVRGLGKEERMSRTITHKGQRRSILFVSLKGVVRLLQNHKDKDFGDTSIKMLHEEFSAVLYSKGLEHLHNSTIPFIHDYSYRH